MDQLDAVVSKVMNQRADVFAENVGGFLENNGFVVRKRKYMILLHLNTTIKFAVQ